MFYQLEDKKVVANSHYYVAPGAIVVGDVQLHSWVSVWFNAVIRADEDIITLGESTNIQDGAVLHTDSGYPIKTGKGVTVGHKSMLHGCTIEDFSLIGINSVILNGAVIGAYSLIGANTLVPEGAIIPPGSLVVGTPGKVKRMLSDTEKKMLEASAAHYVHAAQRYRKALIKQDHLL